MTPGSIADPNGATRHPSPQSTAPAAERWSLGHALLAFAGCAALCFAIYFPALNGEFVSDDISYLVNNPFVNALTFENLVAVFDIRSIEKSFTGNYAPVDEILMALERHFFGDRLGLYHAVNLLFHALASVLLVGWLRSARLPAVAALLGGLCFAVHPANVEAVAWMSQLKTVAALAFSLAALLALRRAPALATVLFATALLTKASALFALPTAAAATWMRRGQPGGGARHWVWVGVWAALFGLYAIPELASFRHFGAVEAPPYASPGVQLRSMAAFASRYLVMAATSIGLSTFHEPRPAESWLDPWWLAALPLAALLLWRITVALRRRSEEIVFWAAAAAGYAPVSQIFPFIYPMGDRYLYFVLPGLIGGTLFVLAELRDRLAARAEPAALSRAAIALALALAVLFSVRSHQRAEVWRHETLLFLDAERHYPYGGPAGLLQARRAAQRGDAVAAVEALERAEARGLANFMLLPNDRALAPVVHTQLFRDFIRDMARRWVERSAHWGPLNQAQYHMQAHAYLILDEPQAAQTALERAIAAGGPQDAELRGELAALRQKTPR